MNELSRPATPATRGVPPAVVEAFLTAVFEVELDGVRWRVAPVATRRHGADGFPTGLAAVVVVSGRNARGRPGDPVADEAAHARLATTIAGRGLTVGPAVGRSPDGGWREPSHAVGLAPADVRRLDELVCLARDHRQAAVAVWTPGTLHTVWLPVEGPTTSDRRPARVAVVPG